MTANGLQLAHIAKLVESGQITPQTQAVYEFADIEQAFNELKKGCTRGKIVVKILP